MDCIFRLLCFCPRRVCSSEIAGVNLSHYLEEINNDDYRKGEIWLLCLCKSRQKHAPECGLRWTNKHVMTTAVTGSSCLLENVLLFI